MSSCVKEKFKEMGKKVAAVVVAASIFLHQQVYAENISTCSKERVVLSAYDRKVLDNGDRDCWLSKIYECNDGNSFSFEEGGKQQVVFNSNDKAIVTRYFEKAPSPYLIDFFENIKKQISGEKYYYIVRLKENGLDLVKIEYKKELSISTLKSSSYKMCSGENCKIDSNTCVINKEMISNEINLYPRVVVVLDGTTNKGYIKIDCNDHTKENYSLEDMIKNILMYEFDFDKNTLSIINQKEFFSKNKNALLW